MLARSERKVVWLSQIKPASEVAIHTLAWMELDRNEQRGFINQASLLFPEKGARLRRPDLIRRAQTGTLHVGFVADGTVVATAARFSNPVRHIRRTFDLAQIETDAHTFRYELTWFSIREDFASQDLADQLVLSALNGACRLPKFGRKTLYAELGTAKDDIVSSAMSASWFKPIGVPFLSDSRDEEVQIHFIELDRIQHV